MTKSNNMGNPGNLKQKALTNLPVILLVLALLWLIIAFLVYPNLNLLYETFFGEGYFSGRAFYRIWNSERAMRSLTNSLLLAGSLVVTANVVGIFIVLVTEYFDIKGAKILRIGYMTPLVYSGVVLVSGYNFIYGPNGIVTRFLLNLFPYMDPRWFQGFGAVLFIMTFACTTNHIVFLRAAMKNIDFQTIEAAKNMGANGWTILRRVVLPVLKPNIFAITVLLFLVGLGATSAPLIVGGTDFQTINPMIITFARTINTRDLAAALSIVLGVATILVLVVTQRFEQKNNYKSISKVKTTLVKQKIESKIANGMIHTLAYLAFVIFILPILFIVIFSFTDSYSISTGTLAWQRFTLENYVALFTQQGAFRPYMMSLIYSGLAAIIVVAIVLVTTRLLHKYKKKLVFLEYLMMIPWLLPATLIAVGLMVTYDQPHPLIFNQVLIGTYVMLLIGYVIVLIPFTLRMLKAAFYTVDDSLEEAAKSLGSRAFYTFFKVVLPLIMPTVLAVLVLNFNGRLADFDLTVLLYHPLAETLGITIWNATGESAGANARAMMLVYSVILMLLSTTALYLVYGRKQEETQ